MSKKNEKAVRRPYDPNALVAPPRREWVPLDRGDVCVWELTLGEAMQITERCTRPDGDPRGGHNREQSRVLQIMLSCHHGDEDGSPRVFSDVDFALVYALKLHEYSALHDAIQKVSGASATEAERLRDFTPAMEAVTTPS